MNQPSPEQIRARAYQLYLLRDFKNGRDVDDWLAAEVQLLAEGASAAEGGRPAKSDK